MSKTEINDLLKFSLSCTAAVLLVYFGWGIIIDDFIESMESWHKSQIDRIQTDFSLSSAEVSILDLSEKQSKGIIKFFTKQIQFLYFLLTLVSLTLGYRLNRIQKEIRELKNEEK